METSQSFTQRLLASKPPLKLFARNLNAQNPRPANRNFFFEGDGYMGDIERGEMHRTRTLSSVSHLRQNPRLQIPDTESEDDLSRSDLLPEMTLDYTSQGSPPSSAPFTPLPHSPSPHPIPEQLKRQCIYINRSDDLNQLFNPFRRHGSPTRTTMRSPHESIPFHPPPSMRKDTKVDLRRAVPLRTRTLPSGLNSTRMAERLETLSLSSGSESDYGSAGDLDRLLELVSAALGESHRPDETCRERTESHGPKSIDLNDDLFLTDLRRALFAGRTEADKILNALTRSRAIQVMGWLQLELKDCKDAFRTSSSGSVSAYKKACVHYMRRLSCTHGILPPSFYIHNIARDGDHAVAGGGFADIRKGRMEGQEVCLKVLRLFTTEGNREKILKQCYREAIVWKQLDHSNVLPFLGVNEELFAPSFCLISPWISHGNLMVYLERHPEYDRDAAIRQIADAMRYLHEYDPPIVHADIRGANILVKDDLQCCLADFGLASISESFSSATTASVRTRGSIRWMAPEVLGSTTSDCDDLISDDERECASADKSSRDIYAFGCTVLEIYTGKPPFFHYKQDIRVATEVMFGKRPPRPKGIISSSLWSLVEECWEHEPSQRPSARSILNFLQADIAWPQSCNP